MEWLIQLQGKVVGLDTAPLIYFIEQNEAYLKLVRPFFQAMSQGEFQVVTSVLTLTEVLVHPLRSVDILLGKARGFWIQTATAGIACLTSLSPTVDAPTA
jgi:hypothetical protein